ncbi:Katanin p80 WD40 repeat-containing subunit B1-like protein [Dichanthelium oligosanthes]|uniref:Katanin p80 WD40 repeat-containing subunit B1 homolog n=1 Tax=Dichanthelium oligosanthes TaxID=888268 RepID=A0A1E5UR60_9POAL|nr:Katanin p80 WD40 repeat-containing subunit B1-like protein [Dichanthelium oligosanthes]
MTTNTKRAYKLQEFVAHSSNVNCLKIGRKTSRVLVTGGEDHKVNLWAIGKPNSILSLSGHTSAVESVGFDSTEVFVAAGAASGTIKLWDLEEAKIVRTLTGHRSNCMSVDFHPFGEFFASGSLDTNLKIWDIRRKNCIHTYKGHTRGVNAIRFTPDGRWVVSGGEDNTVKLWDLTAGKLLHEFKCHEGQIQCIDFHPHEFLLATGSADKTVKFWDLETFELIGSTGPEGKLLGCSFNQSCVGIWVVDLTRLEPYATGTIAKLNGHSELKTVSSATMPLQNDSGSRANIGRSSVLQNSENNLKTSSGRLSVSQNSDSAPKETKSTASFASGGTTLKRSSLRSNNASSVNNFSKADVVPVIVPRTSSGGELATDSRSDAADVAAVLAKATRRVDPTTDSRKESTDVEPVIPRASSRMEISSDSAPVTISKSGRRLESATDSKKESADAAPVVVPRANTKTEMASDSAPVLSKASRKVDPGTDSKKESADVAPVMAPRTSSRMEMASDSRRESSAGRVSPFRIQSRYAELRKLTHAKVDANKVDSGGKNTEIDDFNCQIFLSRRNGVFQTISSEETREDTKHGAVDRMRGSNQASETPTIASEEDVLSLLMEQHDLFLSSTRSRLTKLQIIHQMWVRNDIRGVLSAMEKMCDHAVSADIASVLMEKTETITLDLCTSILPVITDLLESKTDRHLGVSLELLVKLVRTFGPMIHSTVSAGPSSVGVDLEAEQRRERCNLCFIELEKVKNKLPLLTRIKGAVANAAQELTLVFQEVMS